MYAIERAKKLHIFQNVFVEYKNKSELLPVLLNKKIDAIARGEIRNEYQACLLGSP